LRYLFEDCAFDTSRRELHRGGKVVSVAPQVFDLLDYLIRNRERVVSKDDLIAAVWDGRIVSDTALTTRLNVARGAIGDSGEEQRLIKTLQRRGFRFVGAVREEAASDEAGPTNAVVPASQPALALPDKPSIAVLPFQNMSGDPAQDYFADGVVEEIITSLSRKKGLFVIARSSSFSYKGKQFDVRQVASELGVRYVLEGSLRKVGSKIRVTGKLIEGVSGTHLWANRFEGNLEDIFDLQDQITSDAVNAIDPEIQRAEISRSKRKPATDLNAYDYFLRAIAAHHAEPITKESSLEARRLWKHALEIDPDYALALANFAAASIRLNANGWAEDRARTAIEAVEAARRALSIDRTDPDVLVRGGWTIGSQGRLPEEGIRLMDEGLSLDTNHALGWAWSSFLHVYLGNHGVALKRAQNALRLSPRDSQRHIMFAAMANSLFFQGDYEKAASFAEETIKLEFNQPYLRRLIIAAHAFGGRMTKAQAMLAQLLDADPAASISKFAKAMPYHRPEDRARLDQGLRLAGLPE
jgi:TolB-like protein/Tfp pilus assembly protein PilF